MLNLRNLLFAALVACLAAPVAIAGPANTNPTALEWAQAASAMPANIILAEWFVKPTDATSSVAIDDDALPSGLPSHGPTFSIMTSGRADCIDNTSGQGYFCSHGH